MTSFTRNKLWRPALVAISLIISTAAVLKISGRTWFAPDGNVFFWYGEANGTGTSQHFLDPYSFTHFLHGVMFCWVISWVGKNAHFAWQLICGIALESVWEVVENSELVINRYREATIALGYFGDSILNSVSDILMCSLGFYAARRLGLKKSMVMFALIETFLIFWIKDSLIINIIMLIHPVEAIKLWQAS